MPARNKFGVRVNRYPRPHVAMPKVAGKFLGPVFLLGVFRVDDFADLQTDVAANPAFIRQPERSYHCGSRFGMIDYFHAEADQKTEGLKLQQPRATPWVSVI